MIRGDIVSFMQQLVVPLGRLHLIFFVEQVGNFFDKRRVVRAQGHDLIPIGRGVFRAQRAQMGATQQHVNREQVLPLLGVRRRTQQLRYRSIVVRRHQPRLAQAVWRIPIRRIELSGALKTELRLLHVSMFGKDQPGHQRKRRIIGRIQHPLLKSRQPFARIHRLRVQLVQALQRRPLARPTQQHVLVALTDHVLIGGPTNSGQEHNAQPTH